MRWLKRFLIFLILAALVLAGIKLVHLRKQQLGSVPSPQRPAMVVHTERVIDDSLEITQTYRGVVRPERVVALTPRVQGRIEHIHGQAGDEVQAGQVLVRIDDQEVQQEMDALRADIERIKSRIWILEKNYSRQHKLVKQGNISQEVFDQTRSDLQQARSELKKAGHQRKQLQTRLDYTRLDTDVNGRIQKRLMEPGDMAQPGKPVMLLEDVSTGYNVHVRVPAAVQADLHPGREILLSWGGQKETASIEHIHPATAQTSPLIEIEAFVPKPPFGLASGASLQAELVIDRFSGLIVPSRSLFSQEQGSFVFVVDDDNHIQAQQVQVMARTADKAAVRGRSLNAGQRVVAGPLSQLMRLSPGMEVVVTKEPAS